MMEIGDGVRGNHTYIDRDQFLNPIAEKYHRKPAELCLKIGYRFFLPPEQALATYNWSGEKGLPIMDCARLQNICYWHGLAPRVYAVDIIDWYGWRAVCQLQDYAGESEGSNAPLFREVVEVIEEYGGFHRFSLTDGGTWNSAGGKWLGFKAAGFKDNMERYLEKINWMSSVEAHRHLANFKGNFNEDFLVAV